MQVELPDAPRDATSVVVVARFVDESGSTLSTAETVHEVD